MNWDEIEKITLEVVGRNIRLRRERMGMSQTAFANMISESRTYESDIENGKHNISTIKLMRIADGLDVPVTELFYGLSESAPRNLTRKEIDYFFLKLSEEE